MAELVMMRLMELAPGKKAVIRRLEGGPQFFHVWLQCVLHPEPLLLFYEVAIMGLCWSLYAVPRVALGREEAIHIFVSFAGKEKPAETVNSGTLSIALIGQPNVAKSSAFNLLTGLYQHVGCRGYLGHPRYFLV